ASPSCPLPRRCRICLRHDFLFPAHSDARRRSLSESLTEETVEQMLFCGQSKADVMGMTPSDAKEIYESKAFANWKEVRDHDLKMQAAVIERLDGLAKQISGLSRALGRFGKD